MKKFLLISLATFSTAVLVFFAWFAGMLTFHQSSSDSMEPTIMIGDWMIRNPFNTSPKIGDIVTFECLKGTCGLSKNGGATHRLTAISSTGCMTIIGDNPKYDWSKVPCYMPGVDIEIIGVDHKL